MEFLAHNSNKRFQEEQHIYYKSDKYCATPHNTLTIGSQHYDPRSPVQHTICIGRRGRAGSVQTKKYLYCRDLCASISEAYAPSWVLFTSNSHWGQFSVLLWKKYDKLVHKWLSQTYWPVRGQHWIYNLECQGTRFTYEGHSGEFPVALWNKYFEWLQWISSQIYGLPRGKHLAYDSRNVKKQFSVL